MEFWGAEVKPGEPLKVRPQLGKLIHISQAALGEVKDVKGAKHVPLRMKIDSKSFILGALSAEERTQLMFDLVFEREFELSHDWENGSVYFMGYIADDPVSDEEDFSDEFEDEPVAALQNGNINKKLENLKDAKNAVVAKAGNKKEEKPDSDEDEDDDEFDSDDEMAFIKSAQEDSGDDSEEDSEDEMDGSFSSEEEPLKKAQQTKKRPADSAPAPVFNKKAKPSAPNNTGNKKNVHNANPLPSKQAVKGPASNKLNKKNKKKNMIMSRK